VCSPSPSTPRGLSADAVFEGDPGTGHQPHVPDAAGELTVGGNRHDCAYLVFVHSAHAQRGHSESRQSYLQVILELEALQKVARTKDIADRLKIQRGSVTGALKSLEEKGLIRYQPYAFITLTDSGKTIAEEIAHRHRVLKDFLLNVLQVDEPTAETTACRMEHVIDRTTVDRLVCFIEYIHAHAGSV
jgi:DtxR family Mn-dependent transcriptional regulator